MTPGARVSAAIDVLDQILAGQPAEQALTRWARGARFAGSKDRAAVRDHVFQALRCRRSYAALGGAETGRGLMIGALRAEGADPSLLFTGEGYAPNALTSDEKRAGEAPDTEAARMDLPDWLWAAFQHSLGDSAPAAAQALQGRAPVMLRVNSKLSNVVEAIDKLQENGIRSAVSDIVNTALIVTEGQRRITSSPAYLDGLVELQDGSSQAAMQALDISSNARVLDYCAGGGGKSLALAARGARQCFAHDINVGRTGDIGPRAKRAGVNIKVLKRSELQRHGPYDLVLCDVPCSGSGTWRRTPDAKWRLTPERLAELQQLQAKILQEAAPLVAPGGRLAYTTCSVLRGENADQVQRFVNISKDWRLISDQSWPIGPSGDGFYLAQLCRVS